MKNEIKDPSKEGVLGLKGLGSIDQQVKDSLPAKIEKITPYQAKMQMRQLDENSVSQKDVFVDGFGDSKLDKGVRLVSELDNLSNFRGENQSGIELISAGIAKAGVLASTTFVNSTAGLIWGAIEASRSALNGEDFKTSTSKFWDNDVTKAMIAVNDMSEELMPNYYTDLELNTPWYDNMFTANFVGDKMIKNMGFTIGSIGAAALAGGLINPIALKAGVRAGSIISRTLTTAVSAAGEASFEAANGTKEFADAQIANSDQFFSSIENEIRQKYEKAGMQIMGRLDKFVKSPDGSNAYSQNQLDLLALKDQMDAELQQLGEERILAIEAITNERINAGNFIMGANMAILAASNNILFSRILSGGFNNSKKILGHKMINKATGEALEEADLIAKSLADQSIEFVKKDGFKRTLASKVAANSLSEASEEASLNLASNTALTSAAARVNKFLGYKLNSLELDDLDNRLNAFQHSLQELFGSIDSPGWEEFVLGGLSGAIGVPIVSRVNGKVKPSWSGGAIDAYRKAKDEYTSDELIQMMNEKVLSNEFLQRYQNLIRRNSILKEMDEALLNDDIFEFKNGEQALLISDAIMFRNMDQQDSFMKFLDTFTDLSDEDVESIRNSSLDKDTGVSIYQGKTNDDVKQDIKDKAQKTKDRFKSVLDIYENLAVSLSGKVDNNALEEIAYMNAMVNDAYSRFNDISQSFGKSMDTILAQISRYDEGRAIVDGVSYEQEYKSIIDAVNIFKNAINRDPIQFLKKLNNEDKAIRDSLKEVADYINDNVTLLSSDKFQSQLDDLIKLSDMIDLYKNRILSIIKNDKSIQEFNELVLEEEIVINDESTILEGLMILQEVQNVKSIKDAKDLFNSSVFSDDGKALAIQLIEEGKVSVPESIKAYMHIQPLRKYIEEIMPGEYLDAFDSVVDYAESILDLNGSDKLFSKISDKNISDNLKSNIKDYFESVGIVNAVALVIPEAPAKKPDKKKKETEKKKKEEPVVSDDSEAKPDESISEEDADNQNDNNVEKKLLEDKLAEQKQQEEDKRESERKVSELDKKQNLGLERRDGKMAYYKPTIKYRGDNGLLLPDALISEGKKEEDITPLRELFNKLLENGAFEDIHNKVNSGDKVFIAKMHSHKGDEYFIVKKDSKGKTVVLGSFPHSSSIRNYLNAQEFVDKAILNSVETNDGFTVYTGSSLTVERVMYGKIEFSKNGVLQNLSEIEGAEDIMLIGSYGEASYSNDKIKDEDIGVIPDLKGSVYLLHDKGHGKKGYIKVFISHFNENEIKYDESNPYIGGVKDFINSLNNVIDNRSASNAFKILNRTIYTAGLKFNVKGDSIIIKKTLKDGSFVYTKILIDRANPNNTKKSAINALYKLNLPMNVDKSKLKNAKYKLYLFNSGILKSSISSNKLMGSWFVTKPKDTDGKTDIAAVTPRKSAPKPADPSLKESTIPQRVAIKINGVELYFNKNTNSIENDQGKSMTTTISLLALMDLVEFYEEGDSKTFNRHGDFYKGRNGFIINVTNGVFAKGGEYSAVNKIISELISKNKLYSQIQAENKKKKELNIQDLLNLPVVKFIEHDNSGYDKTNFDLNKEFADVQNLNPTDIRYLLFDLDRNPTRLISTSLGILIGNYAGVNIWLVKYSPSKDSPDKNDSVLHYYVFENNGLALLIKSNSISKDIGYYYHLKDTLDKAKPSTIKNIQRFSSIDTLISNPAVEESNNVKDSQSVDTGGETLNILSIDLNTGVISNTPVALPEKSNEKPIVSDKNKQLLNFIQNDMSGNRSSSTPGKSGAASMQRRRRMKLSIDSISSTQSPLSIFMNGVLYSINNGDNITYDQLQSLFYGYSKNERLSGLFEKVNSVLKHAGISVNIKSINSYNGKSVLGYYENNNLISINIDYLNSESISDEQKAEVIVHELIHAATVFALSNRLNKNASKTMRSAANLIVEIFDHLKSMDEFSSELWMSSPEEMVAEMASGDLYNALSNIKDSRIKGKSLWLRFKDAISRLLFSGLKNQYLDLLDQLYKIIDNFDYSLYQDFNKEQKPNREINISDKSDINKALSKSKISWIHPSLTGYNVSINGDKVIDFDLMIKEKSDKYIYDKVSINGFLKEDLDLYSYRLNSYMNNISDDKDYINMIQEEWNKALSMQKADGSRIVTSNTQILLLNKDMFDMILSTSEKNYMKNFGLNGIDYDLAISNKLVIDNAISEVNFEKVFYTEKLYDNQINSNDNLFNSNKKSNFTLFSELSEQDKQDILDKGITEKDFDSVPLIVKENIIKCL